MALHSQEDAIEIVEGVPMLSCLLFKTRDKYVKVLSSFRGESENESEHCAGEVSSTKYYKRERYRRASHSFSFSNSRAIRFFCPSFTDLIC